MFRKALLPLLVFAWTSLMAQPAYSPSQLPDHWLILDQMHTSSHVASVIQSDLRRHGVDPSYRSAKFADRQSRYVSYLHHSGLIYQDQEFIVNYLDSLVRVILPPDSNKEHTFRCYLYRNPSMNGFVLGVNYIYVHPGLIAECENEDQLALVLAHEIAHQLEAHVYFGYERIEKAKARTAITSRMGLTGILLSIADFSLGMKYNRDQETEADQMGAEMICQAGFSVAEAVKLYERFSYQQKQRELLGYRQNTSIYGSTHPKTADRIESLKNSCTSGNTGSVTPRFREVRQYCRYEVVHMFTEEYDFRSAIGSGWRYLGKSNDSVLSYLTFDALRRLKLMHPEVFALPILSNLYKLNPGTTRKLMAEQQQLSGTINDTLRWLFLGDDVSAFSPAFANPGLTFYGLYRSLEKTLAAAPNCPPCQVQLALSNRNSPEVLARAFSPSFAEVVTSGKIAWSDSGRSLLMYTSFDISEAKSGNFFERSFEEVRKEFAVVGDSHYLSKYIRGPVLIDHKSRADRSPRARAEWSRLAIIASEAQETNLKQVDVFLLDPKLYPLFESRQLNRIDLIDLQGVYVFHKMKLPGVLCLITRSPPIRAKRLTLDLDQTTFKVTGRSYSRTNVISYNTLQDTFRELYEEK